jgi:photosystem II stability/assembly factor-like uncharacterized protein
MNRLTAVLLVILFSACSPAPTAAPSASPTAAVASPTPIPPPSPTPAPTAAPTASPTLIPLPNFAQIDAPTGTVVWTIVADSRLFRSTDRGDTWQERPMPPSLPVVFSFIDDHEGWALVPQGGGVPPPAGGACTAPSVALQHTSDAGATWQQLAPTGLVAGPCKASARFADALHGYVAAFNPNGSPLVYRSADGGRIWTASRPFADPPGFTTKTGGGTTLGIGRIGSFGTALLVTAFPTNPATGTIYVYRSTDGGATWAYASTAPNQSQDVAFVTATRWLQIASPGDSKETTDGGATWHAYVTTYQQAAPIAPAVTFGDAQVGYATVRGTIARTLDGGAHWTSLRTPGTF